MAIHFSKEEFSERKSQVIGELKKQNLDGLLMFRQESMYWLTGYDTFGYVYFQCLILTTKGELVLLTRVPDLRQAQNTSIIKDIRIWVDKDNANPANELKNILSELNLEKSNIGVEYEAYGLTGRNAIRLNNSLNNFANLHDKSELVSFLRIINQKNDDLAFERIINVPKRSIGDSTVKQLHHWGRKNKKSLEDSAVELLQLNKIKPKTKLGLVKIFNLFNKWRSDLKKKKHYELMEIILDESGYSKMLKDKKDLESEGRLENLKELIRGMHDFDNLQGFLEHVALATSIDQDWDGQKVNLMTMHAAKGLEFDAVFLPGWEEGLFPHQKSLEEKGDLALEEERRLAYVGLTRAKKESFISFVMSRMYRGDWVDSLASRFIDELPEKNIEKKEAKKKPLTTKKK